MYVAADCDVNKQFILMTPRNTQMPYMGILFVNWLKEEYKSIIYLVSIFVPVIVTCQVDVDS